MRITDSLDIVTGVFTTKYIKNVSIYILDWITHTPIELMKENGFTQNEDNKQTISHRKNYGTE